MKSYIRVSFPVPDDIDKWTEAFRRNWEKLDKQDDEAREAGKLLGRYIAHPFADGQAVYIITNESKYKVVIRVVTGLGDDWVLPAWGESISIPKVTAQQFLRGRDGMKRLFSKVKK